MGTQRITVAQAIVGHLISQTTELGDGSTAPLFPGVFGIFGHGNVTCLGHALEERKDVLPTWRGQNEQGMALAATAYNKAVRRRQIMTATSSIGPRRNQHGDRGRRGAFEPHPIAVDLR